MTLPIYQIDAFAEDIFTGNPAAVIPLDHWIDEYLMQKIAMENNLSETVFFVKNGSLNRLVGDLPNTQYLLLGETETYTDALQSRPTQHSEAPSSEGFGEATYHIRWFTPEYEIDLCGHATLASAYVIKNFIEPHLQNIHFTTEKAGPLKVIAKDGIYTLDFPSRMPLACEVPDGLLKSLGLDIAVEVLKSRDYFVVLPNEESVKNIQPDYNLMKELDTIGVIVTAKGQSADVVSRCFYPGAGIPEDPVTGSAHCNIVPYWSEKLNKNKLTCLQASPRGGVLECELKENRVLMSGKCVLFLEGKIYV